MSPLILTGGAIIPTKDCLSKGERPKVKDIRIELRV